MSAKCIMSDKEPAEPAEPTIGKKRVFDDVEKVPPHAELVLTALEKFHLTTLCAWAKWLKETGNSKIHSSGTKWQVAASIVSAGDVNDTLRKLADASSTSNKMNRKDLVFLAQELWHQYSDSHGYSKTNKMPVAKPLAGDIKDKLLQTVRDLQRMHGKLAPGVDVSQLSKRANSTPTPVTPGPGASNAQGPSHIKQKTRDSPAKPHADPSPLATPDDVVPNQGGFGVCAAFAFAFCVARILMWTFGFAIDATAFAEKIKILIPCWHGAQLDRMSEAWNKLPPDQAWVENTNKNKRIHFKLEQILYKCFQQAYQQLKILHKANLPMLVSMKIEDGNHAVVGQLGYEHKPFSTAYPNIVATNSWGSTLAVINIPKEDFNYAIELRLKNWKVLDGKGQDVHHRELPHVVAMRADMNSAAEASQALVESAASAPGPSSPTTYSEAVVRVLRHKKYIHRAEVHMLYSEKAVLEQENRIAHAASAGLTQAHIKLLQGDLTNLQDTERDAREDHHKAEGELDRMMSELSEADKASLLQLDN